MGPHSQDAYYFKEPVGLAAGTKLDLTAYYDNTIDNPDNPNRPPKSVRSGHRTEDEVCAAFIKYTLDAENRDVSSPEIESVSIDDGTLVVKGKGFLAGADIEVDGNRVADTRNHKKKKKAGKKLMSDDDWKSLVAPSKQVSITVLNTDGGRSAAINFAR